MLSFLLCFATNKAGYFGSSAGSDVLYLYRNKISSIPMEDVIQLYSCFDVVDLILIWVNACTSSVNCQNMCDWSFSLHVVSGVSVTRACVRATFHRNIIDGAIETKSRWAAVSKPVRVYVCGTEFVARFRERQMHWAKYNLFYDTFCFENSAAERH